MKRVLAILATRLAPVVARFPSLGAASAVVLGLAPLLTGCGWHAGLVTPEGAHSVGVEIFETRRGLLERGLEPILSDALTRAVSDFVDLRLAPPSEADVVVRGTIEDYRRRSGIRTEDNRLAETGVYVLVTSELVDRRSGDVLAGPSSRYVWAGYALGADSSENEALARRRAVRHVAESLVLDLFRTPRAEEENAAPSEG